MFGGVRAAGWATILAGGFILVGNMPAAAADLGGNCCADLEERIAELEATTARRGASSQLQIDGTARDSLRPRTAIPLDGMTVGA